MEATLSSPTPRILALRPIGLMLVGIGLLSVAVALHHPEPASRGDSTAVALASIAGEAQEIYSVHGTLILLMLLTVLGLREIFRKSGLDGVRLSWGMSLMAIGMTSMSMAAVINGFSIPLFASKYPLPLTPESDAAARAILFLGSSINRVFANIAVLATSASAALIGAAMLKRAGLGRIAGMVGIAVGAISLGGLMLGLFELDYAGFNLTNALLYLWVALVGLWAATGASGSTSEGL